MPSFHSRRLAGWIALAAVLITSGTVRAADEPPPGAAIYKRLCASCHGPTGEGTDDYYPQKLLGDKSVAQLASLIAETMPEDDPEKCTGDDARAVAAYIHEAFYSPLAQARNKPARIELARLTVRQYENAVADLLGSFRPGGRWDANRGLEGEYFKSRRFRKQDLVLTRRDAAVAFDFGEGSPVPGKIEPGEFSIRWKGAVFAPETGEYDFVLKTESGARLWVNDESRPLIDAWVQSGDDREHRAAIRLLGGRAYPLRLEMFKRANEKAKETRHAASVALWWQIPRRAEEPIPSRCLSPNWFPETFVIRTPFPPDDRTVGYERGTSISKAWDEATTAAAVETADHVVSRLRQMPELRGEGPDRQRRLREICLTFAQRAFRRPLTEGQKKLYVDRQFAAAPDAETAVKRVVMLVLKSPRFLYHGVGMEEIDAFDVASRISFALWDSLPDEPLLAAAASGKLETPQEVAAQAERMLPDLRTRAKLREFLLQWLKVEHTPELAKSAERYPAFDERAASDLRTSLDLLLDGVIWQGDGDFRRLLLADRVPMNGRLAALYGAVLPADAPFQEVALEPEHRAGVLSHPYLAATFAYTSTSSPIHRGVFLARSVLGRSLKPPPEAVAPLAPDLHPDLTTRQRVAEQTSPQACQTCHGMINPLGFALEHFDAVGRYRQEEGKRPIDATGLYVARSGEKVRFDGARELAEFLAQSEETHEAFVRQLFHYLVKQPITAYGPDRVEKLREAFAAENYNVRKLLVAIVAQSALAEPVSREAKAQPTKEK